LAAEQATAPDAAAPKVASSGAEMVIYKDKRMTIGALFGEYGKVEKELEGVAEKEKVARDRLADLQRQQAEARKGLAAEQAPVRADLGKARAEDREARRALNARPPARPRLLPMPPRPQVRTSDSGNSSSSDNSLYRWQAECQRIQQQNQQTQKRYQDDVAEYKAKQAKAKQEIAKIEAKVKGLLDKLAEMEKESDAKQPETIEAMKTVNEEILSCDREAMVIKVRLKEVADAIGAAPEDARLKAGVIAWEDGLHDLARLEALHETLQGEIDRVREQLKTEAEKLGLPFSSDWRHPQQDRMDALKVLIDKAKAAQGAK